ncbi:hypothetical protein EBZ39_00475 [bacterium]|nr:hypothetical protein [bacterium]
MTTKFKDLTIRVDNIGAVVVDGGYVIAESPEMVALEISVERAKYVDITQDKRRLRRPLHPLVMPSTRRGR